VTVWVFLWASVGGSVLGLHLCLSGMDVGRVFVVPSRRFRRCSRQCEMRRCAEVEELEREYVDVELRAGEYLRVRLQNSSGRNDIGCLEVAKQRVTKTIVP
jgi:hypothetical protein